MEVENDIRIAFLDMLVVGQDNGTFGHEVYRKPAHTDRYLNTRSNYQPQYKMDMMKILPSHQNMQIKTTRSMK